MELAAHTRKGYLPLFKKPAEWSQEATVTSQWAQVLNNDAAQHNYQSEQVVSQENLAAFAWLQRGDDRRAIDCRVFVHNTISNGLAHHASRIECSLLGEHGYVLDGQRAVLETIDLASAKQCAPEGVLILPIGTLSFPKPMENYLCIVKSICEQHLRTQGVAPRVGEAAPESADDSLMDLTTGEAAGQCSKEALIAVLKDVTTTFDDAQSSSRCGAYTTRNTRVTKQPSLFTIEHSIDFLYQRQRQQQQRNRYVCAQLADVSACSWPDARQTRRFWTRVNM